MSDTEKLTELMRGLEIPPAYGAFDARAFFVLGQKIAEQAKQANKAVEAADWVCVPREPTEEMLRVGHAAYMHGEGGEGGHGGYELDRQLYRAMIQASPARVGEGEVEFEIGRTYNIRHFGPMIFDGKRQLYGEWTWVFTQNGQLHYLTEKQAAMSREAQ